MSLLITVMAFANIYVNTLELDCLVAFGLSYGTDLRSQAFNIRDVPETMGGIPGLNLLRGHVADHQRRQRKRSGLLQAILVAWQIGGLSKGLASHGARCA